MKNYPEADKINEIIKSVEQIVIIQADNPDADSLGSALALESILGEMGKQPYMYCAVDMPSYLRYMSGWDRVESELPDKFDACIVVDASTMTLLEKLINKGLQKRLASKPCIVLDHHESVEQIIPFATVMINDHKRASTGELIYILAKQTGWTIPLQSQEYITTSILGDTQGLSNSLASADTYRIMAEFIDSGVDRPSIEEQRREYGKMPTTIYKYKAQLIGRTKFSYDNSIAYVEIPQTEINEFSPLYNPAPLIQGDMLQVSGVKVAIVFKQYTDGKVTGAIRCNQGSPVAADLAEHLGGGGHAFASGFKVTDGRDAQAIKQDCLNYASDLLGKLTEGQKS